MDLLTQLRALSGYTKQRARIYTATLAWMRTLDDDALWHLAKCAAVVKRERLDSRANGGA